MKYILGGAIQYRFHRQVDVISMYTHIYIIIIIIFSSLWS